MVGKWRSSPLFDAKAGMRDHRRSSIRRKLCISITEPGTWLMAPGFGCPFFRLARSSALGWKTASGGRQHSDEEEGLLSKLAHLHADGMLIDSMHDAVCQSSDADGPMRRTNAMREFGRGNFSSSRIHIDKPIPSSERYEEGCKRHESGDACAKLHRQRKR